MRQYAFDDNGDAVRGRVNAVFLIQPRFLAATPSRKNG